METEINNYHQKCQFISKVYNTLFCQILTMIAFISLSILGQSYPVISIILHTLLMPSIVMIIVSQLAIFYLIENMTPWWTYFWVSVFNISTSIMVANTTAFIPYDIIIMSLFMTLIIVVFLNYHASITKYKYSQYNSLAVSVLSAMIIQTFVSYYFGFNVNTIVSSTFSAFLFGLFIVIDTQSLTENDLYMSKHNGHYIASINLYLDIINLFINIISILNTTSRKVKKKNNDYEGR
jgi:FtsH-binding integral membrane protein